MRISEIFYSLQGEGFLAGTPGWFIRLTDCPLRCRWCDTKYAWSNTAGRYYSIDKIIQTIQTIPGKFIVITGGEPMIDQDLQQLVQSLKDCGKHITIETAGIAFVPDMPCDLMSISPKLSNSTPQDPELAAIHEDSRLDLAILGELIDNYDYQLKFVVDSEDDLMEINQTLEKLANVNPDKIMLMPQAATRQEFITKAPMVAELCKRTGYVFCQRMQLLFWEDPKNSPDNFNP